MSETPYIVSARKYRPSTFQSVVGQSNLTSTLKNAIEHNRLAQAYLFCGPRGVGKTSCARIFAKTINCLSPTTDGEACGKCESCKAIDEGNSFNIIELDAASNNSVNDIREISEQVNIPPSVGKYRVFIIDEVHMLTSAAFNAFLKTLEEPPSYVIFILATTEKHKVIPTILSRCQIYDFKRITIQDIVDHLLNVAAAENIKADPRALNVIARKADGAMRDALSIFDQVAASSLGDITYESTLVSLNVLDYDYYFRLVDAFRNADIPSALLLYKEIRDHGFDPLFFINGLASHIRDLMVAYSPQTLPLLEVADDIANKYIEQARQFPVDWMYAAMKILNDCDYKYRTASNKQFLVELTIIRLCQLLKPASPPFDRVDSDNIPLRDIATPQITADNTAHVTHRVNLTSGNNAGKEATIAATATSADNNTTNNAAAADSAYTAIQTIDTHKEPRKKPAISRLSSSLRISGIKDNNDSDYSGLELRHQSVTLQQLLDAWDEYALQNNRLKILAAVMRNARPTQIDSENFIITVGHPAEKQAFDGAAKEIISFLRDKLKNDYLTVRAEIDTTKEQIKQLSPQSLLKEMLTANPILADFIKSTGMEII